MSLLLPVYSTSLCLLSLHFYQSWTYATYCLSLTRPPLPVAVSCFPSLLSFCFVSQPGSHQHKLLCFCPQWKPGPFCCTFFFFILAFLLLMPVCGFPPHCLCYNICLFVCLFKSLFVCLFVCLLIHFYFEKTSCLGPHDWLSICVQEIYTDCKDRPTRSSIERTRGPWMG